MQIMIKIDILCVTSQQIGDTSDGCFVFKITCVFRIFLYSRCADLKPFGVYHVLANNLNSKYTNKTQCELKWYTWKHTMSTTSTQKLILCSNTMFWAQVKHTVTLPKRQFDCFKYVNDFFLYIAAVILWVISEFMLRFTNIHQGYFTDTCIWNWSFSEIIMKVKSACT